MRKFIPFLLLASAVPAMASAQDRGGWGRSAQSSQSDDHQSQRAERAERSEARQQVREQAREQFQAQRQVQDSSQGNSGAFAAMRERFQAQQQAEQAQQGDSGRAERIQRYQQLRAEQQQQAEANRAERMQRVQQMQAQQLQQNEALRAERMRQFQQGQNGTSGQRGWRSFTGTNQQVVQTPTRDGVRYDRNATTRWSNNWRDDRRYDWRDYRRHHHSTFHIGFYFDPFGYGYQRYGIGSFLYPSYYQSSFWINDPWQYRLPPVYGPYRWVRYHDDALLIDTWSGQVVDVIYDFFW